MGGSLERVFYIIAILLKSREDYRKSSQVREVLYLIYGR